MKKTLSRRRRYIRWIQDLGYEDLAEVGGKNAALGEMGKRLRGTGIRLPEGFALTSSAYRAFLEENDVGPAVAALLKDLKQDRRPLREVGDTIRGMFLTSRFPGTIQEELLSAYLELAERCGCTDLDVAVRSSATAEDLAEASFAGMLESFLNVRGEAQLLDACLRCYASLFTDRALNYGQQMGFDHTQIFLSVGIQRMIRSDQACAGVMFSLDRDTDFPDIVTISAAWGLGENVVQGKVSPDEYRVFKPLLRKAGCVPILSSVRGRKEKRGVYAEGGAGTVNVETTKEERNSLALSDGEVLLLSRWATAIEDAFGKAMDMEWAKDGGTGQIFIVQARPVTARPRGGDRVILVHRLLDRPDPILTGVSIGDGIAAGRVSLIENYGDIVEFAASTILVAESANTDWVGSLRERQAIGLVTDFGGRNSHAAVVARELGVPGVVGTIEATRTLAGGKDITIAALAGDLGYVYDGILKHEKEEIALDTIPETRTRIMLNVPSAAAAFQWWRFPADGIGLVRMDFILHHVIRIHPLALVHFDAIEDRKVKQRIQALTRNYEEKTAYFVDLLSSCIARIAASKYPDPVIVGMGHLWPADHARLIGGDLFEPPDEISATDLRGASRYLQDRFRETFLLKCQAVRRVRKEIGLANVAVMVPYCASPEDADRLLRLMEDGGIARGRDGLRVYLSCDLPANVTQAEAFARRFDGFSVEAMKIPGLAPNASVGNGAALSTEQRIRASTSVLRRLLGAAHSAGLTFTVRGAGLGRYPELSAALVREGVDCLSVNPPAFPKVKRWVAEAER